MEKLQRCLDAGWVTGTSDAIPTDLSVRFVELSHRVACSQLVCGLCRAKVKHLDGVKIAAEQPRDLDALYSARDASVFDKLVVAAPASRFYYCQCHWYSSATARSAPSLDTSNIGHWRCRGHTEAGPLAPANGRVSAPFVTAP